MSCWCSCQAAAAAALARRDVRRCASRERRRTPPERCSPASGGFRSTAEPVNHLLGVSAFATHAVVARESCVKIDPDLPLELAALFGCAVLTGVGAVVNTAKVEPGQSVAVVGLGGVGLSVVLGARLAGARQIVAVDLSDDKLAFASETRRDADGQRRLDRRGRRNQTHLRQWRRCRLRDGGLRSGARTRLCRDRPRRLDRDRRACPIRTSA